MPLCCMLLCFKHAYLQIVMVTVHSAADGCVTADDAGRRLAEDLPVFHHHAAVQNSDVGNSALLAESAARPILDRHWQHQQLMQMQTELSDVDSRIAHLRILMDLARSVCCQLISVCSVMILLTCSHEI